MIATSNISLRYGKRVLFEEVNIKFTPGNCYGLIGANGAGKSTFLKILSGEIEANTGDVIMNPGARMSVLKQNHFEFDELAVLDTVIRGHKRLFEVMKEKDALYAKPDFNDADGEKVAHLEAEFAEMSGWDAESDAATLLSNLGVKDHLHGKLMKELGDTDKIRVLLAQALFGNPDILLLDEPTNHLDVATISWLENFLADFNNTVIVVSHDRHFLDAVCTHMADIDYSRIQLYSGNYSFWYESSQLAARQLSDQNKKTEDKRKELQDFIARFSANASKSKQATSRKKLLEKLVVDEIKPSNRKYPFVGFKAEREPGNQILHIENLIHEVDGKVIINIPDLKLEREDKTTFLDTDGVAVSTLFQILMGEIQPTSGKFTWGTTISLAYLPKDNSEFFNGSESLVDWLSQYSKEKEQSFLRGFLGRMLFSGEEALKKSNVLSGGEKMRCMLSRMMLTSANVLIFDQPTNHLDLESITAINNGIVDFDGVVLLSSHDHTLNQTIANRVVELFPGGIIDKKMPYDEYLEDERVIASQEKYKAVLA